MFHCTASCRHLAGFYYFYRQICQRGEKTILYCHPTAIQPAMPIAKDCYGLCSAASGEARGSAAHRFCCSNLFLCFVRQPFSRHAALHRHFYFQCHESRCVRPPPHSVQHTQQHGTSTFIHALPLPFRCRVRHEPSRLFGVHQDGKRHGLLHSTHSLFRGAIPDDFRRQGTAHCRELRARVSASFPRFVRLKPRPFAGCLHQQPNR